jgi:hypothetical protein
VTPSTGIRRSARVITGRDWTSPEDYEIIWPDEGESDLRVIYTPDFARGLTDPRGRVLDYDLASGESETSNSWPWRYAFIYFAGMLAVVSTISLLVWRVSRPLQKSDRWGWRMTLKKFDDENAANELMTQMRNRQ